MTPVVVVERSPNRDRWRVYVNGSFIAWFADWFEADEFAAKFDPDRRNIRPADMED